MKFRTTLLCGLIAAPSFAQSTDAPTVESVTPISAMEQPALVTLNGSGLADTKAVFVGGKPAVIAYQAEDELRIIPRAVFPGFHGIEVQGASGTTRARLEAWPSVEVSVVGTSLDVRLGNGDDGLYVLAASLKKLQRPFFLNAPATGYMLWLDDPVVLSVGVIPSTEPMVFGFEIPPAVAGLPINVQAWCEQRCTPTSMTRCFSNMAEARM